MSVSDFADMMVHTITHEEFASRDAYGVKVYGSPVTYLSRVVYKRTLMRADDGSEIVAKGMVWLLGYPTINTEDRITLPDSTTPPILDVEIFTDELSSHNHHTKIYFG